MHKEIGFIKAHGCGNDFVIIDQRDEVIDFSEDFVKKLLDRNFGVGADQLIIIRKSQQANAQMLIFNADGSKALACGNATRVVGSILLKEMALDEVRIEVAGKILKCQKFDEDLVKVILPSPELKNDMPNIMENQLISEIVRFVEDVPLVSVIDAGNLHFVAFVNEMPVNGTLVKIASQINEFFPDGINVNFAEILGNQKILLRTHERGVGLTQACGSGSIATAFAAEHFGLCDLGRVVSVINLGGTIGINGNDAQIEMIGPVEIVFTGNYAV